MVKVLLYKQLVYSYSIVCYRELLPIHSNAASQTKSLEPNIDV